MLCVILSIYSLLKLSCLSHSTMNTSASVLNTNSQILTQNNERSMIEPDGDSIKMFVGQVCI